MSKKLENIRSILMEHHETFNYAIPLIASENINIQLAFGQIEI